MEKFHSESLEALKRGVHYAALREDNGVNNGINNDRKGFANCPADVEIKSARSDFYHDRLKRKA